MFGSPPKASAPATLSSPAGSPSTKRVAPVRHNPDLSDWFPELDSHPIRGKRNLNYAQYVEPLSESGFFDLDDLRRLDCHKLCAHTSMNEGTALRILAWAEEDGGGKRARKE